MPTLPRGVCRLSGQKNGHAYTVGLRADVGIGPYEKTCVFSIGGDAYKNGRSLAVGGVRIKGTSEKPVRDFPTV